LYSCEEIQPREIPLAEGGVDTKIAELKAEWHWINLACEGVLYKPAAYAPAPDRERRCDHPTISSNIR